jgi:UDP-N-acetylglucosamine 2-epimerase (non-hydrolysing)
MQSIALLIGTRPEAIKLMPVIRALQRDGTEPVVLVTGQHRDLLAPILGELEIIPTEDLAVMEHDQALPDLSARILTSLAPALRRHRPELLLVQGDTTSCAMGALAAFYGDVRVAHVEAGLRTGSARNPFPEEMNRRLVACLADLHFAPTPTARDHLLQEGVAAQRIHTVGNTVVDALFHARDHLLPRLPRDEGLARSRAEGRSLVLVTSHRRESLGTDLEAICEGIRRIAIAHAGAVDIVFPVHPNPGVRECVLRILSSLREVRLLPPLGYLRFVEHLLSARLVLTDSGGVQEEAAALGVPVLVTRRTCERLEAVEARVSQLVGPDAERIFAAADELLSDQEAHRRRAVPSVVFGDGRTADRIVKIIASGAA